jgi:central glycolytic genes regulator
MSSYIHLLPKLVPDLVEVIQKRYMLLRQIQAVQPVGRRSLTQYVSMTERVLRSEVEFLRNQGLVQVESIGMSVTPAGVKLLEELAPCMKEWLGLYGLERELANRLGIEEVILVPGDADQQLWVKLELGRAAVAFLKERVSGNAVVAVTGGSTMRAFAEMMYPSSVFKQCTFVPARGGMGEKVEWEANYIVSLLGQRSGGSYRLLHIPDQLSEEAYHALIQEPHVMEVLDLIRQAKILFYGIGEALTMAERRKSHPEVVNELKAKQAVGESFGYYYDRRGEVVHRLPTVGLRLEDIQTIETKVAVAGGKSKAEAIFAGCKVFPPKVLITDEAVAKEILQIR